MKISLGFCILCLGIAAANGNVHWPADPATENMAHASLEFGWKSYRALRVPPGDNFFFSPYSITNALSMLILGSTGVTEADLLTVLNTPEDMSTVQIHEQLRDENAKLSSERNATIGVGNRFFVEQTFVDKVLPKFSNNLRNYYNATIEPTPFSTNPIEARDKINDYVSAATRGMIPNILTDTMPPRTKLSLVNAIYFKGIWTVQFNQSDTSKLPFHAKSGDVQVDFMKLPQLTNLPYAECDNGDCQLVGLSYTTERKYAMYAIIPKEGLTLESLEQNLDHQKLRTLLRAADDNKVNLKMPKFTMRSQFSLLPMLRNFGANNIVGVVGSENSKIFSERVDDSLVDDIIHEAKIEVNEEGTIAAAATVSITRYAALRPPPPPKIVTLDRPFLFIIADMSNGFVLFWGRVENP